MTRVFISQDMASVALGANALSKAFNDAGCQVVRTGSRGLFRLEPMVEIEDGDQRIGYGPVAADDVAAILNGSHPNRLGNVAALPFFASQQRFTFARCGVIDPLSSTDYAAHGGWRGLEKAHGLRRQEVVDLVKARAFAGAAALAFRPGSNGRPSWTRRATRNSSCAMPMKATAARSPIGC